MGTGGGGGIVASASLVLTSASLREIFVSFSPALTSAPARADCCARQLRDGQHLRAQPPGPPHRAAAACGGAAPVPMSDGPQLGRACRPRLPLVHLHRPTQCIWMQVSAEDDIIIGHAALPHALLTLTTDQLVLHHGVPREEESSAGAEEEDAPLLLPNGMAFPEHLLDDW